MALSRVPMSPFSLVTLQSFGSGNSLRLRIPWDSSVWIGIDSGHMRQPKFGCDSLTWEFSEHTCIPYASRWHYSGDKTHMESFCYPLSPNTIW